MRSRREGVDRRGPKPCALLGAGAAPSTAASESPCRTTATATPAAWRRSSSGSMRVGRPTKLGASIQTTLTPCPASERCTSLVASAPETFAVTTTVSTARDAGPPSRARSSTTGRVPSASAAASRPSAASQSPSSDETLTLGRDAELTASTARLPWEACERRIEPAARTCSSKLFPATALASRVEDDGDLVARRVFELLHHQLTAPRGRPPVHLPQRLALLVLAHRVEVEPRRTPQQQPAAVLRVRPALGEEPIERDEPRIDEQRAARDEIDLGVRQPEGVVDRRFRLLDDVASARHLLEHVGASVVARGRAGAACRRSPSFAIRSVTEIEGSGTRASGCASSVTQTSSPSKRWPPLARRPRRPPPIRRRSAIGRAASRTHVRAAIGASTSPVATG